MTEEETKSSSIFLSKGALKKMSCPVLDTMTELEICSGPSSSVQANVYHSRSEDCKKPDINIQDPVLVIPLLPPQLSSKTLATVEQPGFIRLRLYHGMVVDISNDLTVRRNIQPSHWSSSYNAALSLVQTVEIFSCTERSYYRLSLVMLRQQSYATKNQIVASKAPY